MSMPEYSRVSILEHAASRNTDQLYEPLRETFANPEGVQRHSALTPIAARSSFVSHDYKILSPDELQRLQQNVFIPNAALYPTNNLAPIRNERFIAVDASERILGPPISPEALQQLRAQGVKREEVLYEVRREPPVESRAFLEPTGSRAAERSLAVGNRVVAESNRSIKVATSPKSQKLKAGAPPVQEQVVYEYEPLAERYTAQNFEEYGRHQEEYKYNLFSIVDEPFNKCRDFGLQGCTSCPSNEVIAARNRPLSLTD